MVPRYGQNQEENGLLGLIRQPQKSFYWSPKNCSSQWHGRSRTELHWRFIATSCSKMRDQNRRFCCWIFLKVLCVKKPISRKKYSKKFMIWAQKKIFSTAKTTPLLKTKYFFLFFSLGIHFPQLFFKEKKVIRIILCDDELFEF